MSHHTWDRYTPCKVPLRRVSAFDISITVHEGIVADVAEADRRWRELGGPDFYVIEQHHTGSYACRRSVGHSRALAIDFNWQRQPMVSKRTPCPMDPQMPRFYEHCFKPLGYGWGALWRSKCDAMHVTKIPSEGGDGILYRTYDTPPTPSPPPKHDGTYTVRPNDTLSKIGHRLDIPWREIADLNGIRSPYTIHPGDVLRLPGSEPPPADDWRERVMSKPTLRKGARGHEVRLLQTLLVAHGNRPGRWYGDPSEGPDGIFGDGVVTVLSAWQQRTGVLHKHELGFCGPGTWGWLVGV